MTLARMRSPFRTCSRWRAVYCGDFSVGVADPSGLMISLVLGAACRSPHQAAPVWFFFVFVSHILSLLVCDVPPAQTEGTGAGGVRVRV